MGIPVFVNAIAAHITHFANDISKLAYVKKTVQMCVANFHMCKFESAICKACGICCCNHILK